MESQTYLLPNKVEKVKKGEKNQMGQIENKQQDGRAETNRVNNHSKYKW